MTQTKTGQSIQTVKGCSSLYSCHKSSTHFPEKNKIKIIQEETYYS